MLPAFPWAAAAWLYGSAARPSHPARDIDIGLLALGQVEPAHLEACSDIAASLSDRSGWAIERWDVRVVNRADPVFLGRFLREAQLLYERDPAARIAFEARAHSLWLDFRPAWQRIRRAALNGWANG